MNTSSLMGPGVVRLVALAATVLPPAAAAQEAPAVDKLGAARGLCVVLGDPQGAAALELARRTELTILVQAPRWDEFAAVARAADAAGLLGTRIHVQKGDYARLNPANDLIDVVVVGKPAAGIARDELLRILRPGGRVLIDGTTLVKPPAAGTDEWTHPYHGPDNNPQSADVVARRPYLTHFMAEPWYCPLGQMTVVSGGRMFKVFGDRSSAKPQEPLINTLLAMSAFNGTVLWQRPLSPGFMIHRNTLAATPDALYLADDKSCKVLDAADGRLRAEFTLPEGLADGPVWKWMALEGNVLYALLGEKEGSDQPLRSDRLRGAGWPWWKINEYRFGFGRTLAALDARTGKVLWHHKEQERIDGRAVCLKGGRLYYYCDGKFLACLDAKSGNPVWKNSDTDLLEAIGQHGAAQHWMLGFASTAYMKAGDDALFFAGPQRPRIAAASVKDGKLLWKRDGGNVQLVLRADGLYALGEGRTNSVPSSFKLEPLTGKVLATFPSRDRCTRATGCVDSIFTRGGAGGSTSVFDVTGTEPRMGVVSPMRPACQDGVVTAHGFLFWGPWMCRCDLTQLGVISLGPGGSFDYTAKATDAARRERVDAIEAATPALSPDDWPTYRRDNARTGVTAHTTPARVRSSWDFRPAGRTIPTAPVAAAGLVLTAGADGAVRALDAAGGKPRWTAYTGGPIRYPPAVAQGRAYVGSGDGWVYCFELAGGRLLWRFRAAPVERTIPVYGSLSSTWPVGSGVLVDNGAVYAAAGISNFDGTHVYSLDAGTGRLRWSNHTSGDVGKDLPDGGVSVQGPLLLHKGSIYMAAGNRPTVAAYSVADGRFAVGGGGRGKDLFVRNGQVRGAGFPLYWRPEDDHFLSPMELETPAGVFAVTAAGGLAKLAPGAGGPKPATEWTARGFQEVAAVAFTRNAVLVTGLDRDAKNPQKIDAALTALSLTDGKPLWRVPLAGVPTAWGLALDREGRMIVTLLDGRVQAFERE